MKYGTGQLVATRNLGVQRKVKVLKYYLFLKNNEFYLNMDNLNDPSKKNKVYGWIGTILALFIFVVLSALWKKYINPPQPYRIPLVSSTPTSNVKDSSSNCPHSVAFGDRNICLPTIDGMTECYSDTTMKNMLDKFAVNAVLLGFYLNNNSYQKKQDLGKEGFDDYFIVSSDNDLMNRKINTSDLTQLDSVISDNFIKKNWDDVSSIIKKKINKYKFAISFDKPLLIDSYSLNENIHSRLFLTKLLSGNDEIVMICDADFCIIKNRLIHMFYYKKYDGEQSLKDARSKNDYIALAVINENK
jgi:hypothetical protein